MSTDPSRSDVAPTARKAERLDFVDAMRGLAVLLMIFWHTLDGWVVESAHGTRAWDAARLLGGLAAPLFHLLAGAGAALKAQVDARRGRSHAQTRVDLAARALEIVVFAYAMRFQMWFVDSAGFLHRGGLLFVVIALGALALTLSGLSRLDRSIGRGAALAAAGVALYGVGLYVLSIGSPRDLSGLLRVDVLHSIGAGLFLVALFGRSLRLFERPLVPIALAFIVASLAPVLERVMPGPLPNALAGYIAKWPPPEGQRAATLFPLAPWLAFVLAGVALGTVWDRAAQRHATRKTVIALAIVGAIIAFVLSDFVPLAHRIEALVPWGTAVPRVAYRLGLCLVLAPFGFLLAKVRPAIDLGRASLPVYWIHMEFAFGIAARPVKHAIEYPVWAPLFAVLAVSMWGVSRAYLGPWKRWLARHDKSGSPRDAARTA